MKAGIMVRAKGDFKVFNTKHQMGNTYMVLSVDPQYTILADHPLLGMVSTFPVPADRIETDFEALSEEESARLKRVFGYKIEPRG